jgi:hypothetical protein
VVAAVRRFRKEGAVTTPPFVAETFSCPWCRSAGLSRQQFFAHRCGEMPTSVPLSPAGGADRETQPTIADTTMTETIEKAPAGTGEPQTDNETPAIPAFARRQVQYVDPKTLTIHKLIEKMPRLPEKDPRYTAMQASWIQTGHLPPLYVCDGAVVDGRHRLWFALAHAVPQVPVIEVEETEIASVVTGAIVGRAHSTKGQRAYLAIPYLAAAFERAAERAKAVAAAGGSAAAAAPGATMDDLAAQIGISRDLLYQARRLHDIFDEAPELREKFEPLILAAEDPMSLGSAVAGLEGGQKGKANAKRNSAFQKFTSSFRNLAGSCKGFDKMKAAEVGAARDAVLEVMEKMPASALKLISGAAAIALKRAAKAKK